MMRSALRSSIAAAWGRRDIVARAGAVYDLACTLTVVRPHDWERRSERAFRRVIHQLRHLDGPSLIPPAPVPEAARALLEQARRPLWRSIHLAGAAFGLVASVIAALLLCAAMVSPALRHWLVPVDVAQGRPWTSSSAFPDTPSSGTALSNTEPFFFHTNLEEHPWLRIELGRKVRIGSIRIGARTDCCADRTVPLNVEVPDRGGWRLICQRRVPFRTWTCHPGGVEASVVRITLAAYSMLHLSRVQVFE